MKYTLSSLNIKKLDKTLQNIPPNTTKLELKWLRCFSSGVERLLTADILLKIFKASPETVETVNLSINFLGSSLVGRRCFSTDELITVLKALPKNVISLDLSHNNLHNLCADDFVKILQALPVQLKSLNLESNDLGNFSANDLIKILKALPLNLISLDLSCNSLRHYSHEERRQILSSLPKVKHLNLSHIDLNELTGINLSALCAVLPEGLVSLDLSGNELHHLSPQELQQAISSLCADQLTSLYLSANLLEENQVLALLPFLTHSKITLLELQSTWEQNNDGYKGPSKETSNRIQDILFDNLKKILMEPRPAKNSKIYGLQALCGKGITLFTVPFSSANETTSLTAESKRLIELELTGIEGLKPRRY